MSVKSVNRINDRWYDERSDETLWQPEHMIMFAGDRFLPLLTLPSLL